MLTVYEGDALSADDAAWVELAATAERMLKLPGLSPDCAMRMRQMVGACLRVAGLPDDDPVAS